MNEYELLENSIKDIIDQRETANKEKKIININSLNTLILKVFTTYLVSIFGDYQRYLTYIEDQACFNSEHFLATKNTKFYNFYSEIIHSQNFNSFIQNNPENNTLFTKLCLRYTGKRQTNLTEKKNSIMGFFTKKKLFEFNVNDITETIGNSYSYPAQLSKNISQLANVSSISENNSKASKEFGESTSGEIREFIIPPFFIKSPIFDIEKIEEYVSELVKKSIVDKKKLYTPDRLNAFITLLLNYKEDQEKFKRVIIPSDSNSPDVTFIKKASEKEGKENKIKESKIQKNSIFKLAIFDDHKLKEIEKQHEKIKDFVRKILTSQIPSEIEIKNSLSFSMTKHGRKILANLLYQEKFKHHNSHQVSEKGFELLNQVISDSLIHADFVDEQMKDIIKLVRSCFYYYKFNEGKIKDCYYIYKELIKNQLKFFESDVMWSKWYEIESSIESEEESVNFNKSPDDYYFTKFISMFNIMKDLYLESSFIISCIENISNSYIKSNESREILLKVVEKQLRVRPVMNKQIVANS